MPCACEVMREPVGPLLELRVGAGLVGDDQRDPIGDGVDDVLGEICDVPGHGPLVEQACERGQCETAAVDVDLPAEDDPRRVEVRRWFTEHPAPSPRELVEAGFVVPHWPRPYGLDADPALQLIIEGEMRRAGVSKPLNPIGIGHCGPIIVALGNDEQKQRYLWPMLAGEELWCQLFSEPGAGSDLANLGTRAERDGDIYRVNGQKIWTSLADHAKFGILIARTRNDVSKHRGISYFIISMDLPGIEVRPIRNMAGERRLQRGVLHRRARPRREPHRRGEPRLGHGQDHARQRAGLAVDRRRAAVGLRAERARSRRPLPRPRRPRRSGRAPSGGRRVHRR